MQTYGLIFDTCVGIILQYCCLCFWVIDSLQLVLCLMAAVKRLPVHHHCADYIFWPFGIIWFILSHFENKSLLEPVLGSVTNVAYFSTCHEQTQLNRVCYFFCYFGEFLASKGFYHSKLIYLHCSWCYAVWRPYNASPYITIMQILFSVPLGPLSSF